ncbi:MAG: thioredoxin family protein [Bacteroidia bacterium]|nr:thioredoxin family protein [Bacteroidia bacterium]
MNNILKISITLFFATVTLAQDKGIRFDHSSFSELKEKALSANKLIFIDAYTTWCGPCKFMAAKIFTDKAVADFYNANFINAKIDMEKGEGIKLAEQYEVLCYPNLLFIDGNGKLIHRVAGSMEAQSFINLGKKAMQTDSTFSFFVDKFESNKNNPEFMLKYIEARDNTCLYSDDIAKTYLEEQKEDALFSKPNWQIILNHVNDLNDKTFKFIVEHKEKYIELFTKEAVDSKIDIVLKSTLMQMIRSKNFNEKEYDQLKMKIKTFSSPNTERIFFESDLALFERQVKWDKYADLAIKYTDAYYLNHSEVLNSISWNFYENITDVKALEKAEQWIKKACEIKNIYAYLDTYAAILYKLKKKDLALAKANEAIKKAKDDKYSADDYKGTVELIEKIKAL